MKQISAKSGAEELNGIDVSPGRIDALMMLLNISLLIRTLVHYKIRKGV